MQTFTHVHKQKDLGSPSPTEQFPNIGWCQYHLYKYTHKYKHIYTYKKNTQTPIGVKFYSVYRMICLREDLPFSTLNIGLTKGIY